MSLESVAAKVQAANWNDPPSAGVSRCTLESVDATIEGLDGQKLAANIRLTAMGLYVRALGRDIKVNQKVGNKVIDGLRAELLVPEVDFNEVVQTCDFSCPLARIEDVTFSRDLVIGVGPRDTWFGKVKGPQVYNSQGLILDTLPVIGWELSNELESRVMVLPLLDTFHIVPDIWYEMEPRLRLFICQGLPAQERQSSHQPPRPAAPEPPVQVVRPTEAFAEPVLPAFSEELAHPVRAIAPDQQVANELAALLCRHGFTTPPLIGSLPSHLMERVSTLRDYVQCLLKYALLVSCVLPPADLSPCDVIAHCLRIISLVGSMPMNLIISYDDIHRRSVSTLVASTPSLSIKQCFSGDAYPTLLVEYSQKALRAAASKQDKPRPTSRSDAPSSSTSATKVCNFFRFNGWCRFGKFCVYKHDSGDRSSPSTARPLSDSVPDKKPNLATQQGKKEDSKNRDPKEVYLADKAVYMGLEDFTLAV
ncbi:hypothetical protein FOZ60_013862 [Perkinsus olseni]|uniref:C3H1-type domain-containing protein n=1 Tax=Perkinsus olseni TaxID=32597 RepID=A0A7J6N8M1_PEROL|nr:hypothetical protein FOZ60_013862 [Perkinsus olseni]